MNLEGHTLEVKNGDTLTLGSHVLTFVFAPMVHWPEVMVTYDSTDKVLFSADGFGKFGALDAEEDWDDEARRYYIGIVGKYGAQVQKLLKAAAALDIQTICPLHGPVLKENLGHYLENIISGPPMRQSQRVWLLRIPLSMEIQRRQLSFWPPDCVKKLSGGSSLRLGPYGSVKGSGKCLPLRKAGTGNYYLQCGDFPVYENLY